MRALVALTLTGVMCAACAPRTTSVDLNAALRERTGHTIKPADGAALPPGVTLEDGLTADEAVAIALWNSPSFQLVLADLGLARADLVEAGLLRNPVLSLLFPWGPKQFEWTVQFPFEVLWQRPRRVAAAQLNLESVSQRLVWDGLTLVADVRGAFADTLIAERRLALAGESAILTRRVADLTESRLRAGDISELEARSARSDAARVDVLRKAAEYDRDLTGLTLTGIIGLDPAALPIRMILRRAVVLRDERQSLPGSARIQTRHPRRGAGDRSGGGARQMGALADHHAHRDHRRQRSGVRRRRSGAGCQRRVADLFKESGRDQPRRGRARARQPTLRGLARAGGR